MPQITLQQSFAIGGVSLSGRPTRSGEQTVTYEPLDDELAAAGKAGSLTTRTDDNTGVVTLGSGHGIVTSNVVDVYWSTGVRYGMTATVSGNAITVDGGAGDVLPTEATAVVMDVEIVVPFSLTGNSLEVLAIGGNRRSLIQLQQSGGTVHLAADIPADEIYSWLSRTGALNPVAGDTIANLVYSNGDSVNTLRMKAGALLNV